MLRRSLLLAFALGVLACNKTEKADADEESAKAQEEQPKKKKKAKKKKVVEDEEAEKAPADEPAAKEEPEPKPGETKPAEAPKTATKPGTNADGTCTSGWTKLGPPTADPKAYPCFKKCSQDTDCTSKEKCADLDAFGGTKMRVCVTPGPGTTASAAPTTTASAKPTASATTTASPTTTASAKPTTTAPTSTAATTMKCVSSSAPPCKAPYALSPKGLCQIACPFGSCTACGGSCQAGFCVPKIQ